MLFRSIIATPALPCSGPAQIVVAAAAVAVVVPAWQFCLANAALRIRPPQCV